MDSFIGGRSVERERHFVAYPELYHTARVLLEQSKNAEKGQYHYWLACITFSAFTVEAYLNHVGEFLFPSTWKFLERLPPRDKLDLIAKEISFKIDYGRLPWQLFPVLFGKRNDVAHSKNQKLKDQKEIPAHLYDDMQHGMLVPEWQKFCTEQDAEKIFSAVKDMVTALHAASGDRHAVFAFSMQIRSAQWMPRMAGEPSSS